MKASLINIRLTSRYSPGSYAFAVKDFVHYFPRSRSRQVHSLMAALTCLRSVETNLTLTFPSPKSFVCNLPDSGRHVTSVFQGLSLSLAPWGRVGENPGNEVGPSPSHKVSQPRWRPPCLHSRWRIQMADDLSY